MTNSRCSHASSGSGTAKTPSEPTVAKGLVSVVIPCFRQAHFLGDAIESVLKQSCGAFEIIVVDDGSPDDVAGVTQRYAGVRYVRQENRGQAGARNAGLRLSRGEFVVFLDADDRLLPNALEAGRSRLNGSLECGLTFGHVRYIAADGSPLFAPPVDPIEGDYYQAFLEHGNLINTPAAAMFRRDALQKVGGFDETLRGAEDYELYMRVIRTTAVSRHPEVVAERRRHEGSSMTRLAQRLPSALASREKQKKYIRGNPEYEKAYREGLRRWRSVYAPGLASEISRNLRTGNWRQAVRGVWAIMTHPVLAWYVGRRIVVRLIDTLGASGRRFRQR